MGTGVDHVKMREVTCKIREQICRGQKPETLVLHKGYRPEWSEGSVVPPIFQTSTFESRNAGCLARAFEIALGKDTLTPDEFPDLIYSRLNNPNNEMIEDRMVSLEIGAGKGKAMAFNSGMSAISDICLAYARAGDVIAFSSPVYGGTEHLFNLCPELFGIKTIALPAQDLEKSHKLLQKLGPNLKILFLETPANPTLALIDLAELAAMAKDINPECIVVVDNTFLGPIFQSPFALSPDIDIVVYSATKFLCGHSTLVGGISIFREGKTKLAEMVFGFRTLFGNIMPPFNAWLLCEHVVTVPLRMRQQAKNASAIAKFLASHPKVARVYYPELYEVGSEQWRIYQKQCSGPGSMISFDLKAAEREDAFRFLDLVKFCGNDTIALAVSLGSVESLIEHPASMTHSELTDEQLKTAGITDQMIRLSVGLENADDLIGILSFALDNFHKQLKDILG